MSHSDNYRIEVSGWCLDKTFFVEQTSLLWSQDGQKKVALHHALSDKAIVFVRLLTPDLTGASCIPVAYQVDCVQPMDCGGLCEMHLTQLHPRSKESITGQVASKLPEESQRTCEASDSTKLRELEEILQ